MTKVSLAKAAESLAIATACYDDIVAQLNALTKELQHARRMRDAARREYNRLLDVEERKTGVRTK